MPVIPIISSMSNDYTIDSIKENIRNSEKWTLRTLLLIHSLQTEGEKVMGSTEVDNGVGFTGADAEILTSFADQVLSWNKGSNFPRPLSPKQFELCRKKVIKYAGQVLKVITGKVEAPEIPSLRSFGNTGQTSFKVDKISKREKEEEQHQCDLYDQATKGELGSWNRY